MQIIRRAHSVVLAALVFLAPLSLASAQSLSPGTRIRVKSSQVVAPVVGSFQGMRQDTVIVIEDGTAAQIWSFSRSNIDRLEVSAGMRSGNRGPITRWALIGAGAGAVGGFLTALALEGASDSEYNDFLSAAVGAAVGGGIGAAYGYRVLEERWDSVTVPRRVGLVPTRNGVRLTFSASF